jgi:AbrB family looped-hinge helix DNA binding protein
MVVTMDGAGRIVIPKDVRDRLGLRAGQALDLRLSDGRIEIEPRAVEVALVDQGFGLVAVPAVELPPLTADLVRETLEHLRR